MLDFLALLAAWVIIEIIAYFYYRKHPVMKSQATRGLTVAQRRQIQSAQHLHDERVRVIERMGKDWCLHPEFKAGK